MNIYNKFLNISTEDVNREVDIFKLRDWLIKVEENIMSLSISIERIPDFRTKSAKKLQLVLKSQIQLRIAYLKSKRSYQEILLELLKQEVPSSRLIELEKQTKNLLNGNSY